ncbi:hypothetical protein [Pseudoclavibacter sp. CFCC 11306]|uniref:hypothetical protein n=1 Tax=Pseudoclavibacter sp. CFCC 11306 TaxID=1564493 RepID=UPI001301403C|nr:hypothetical protein [Pseudoclavibacter sp. CFCC 11306]KAB1658169.1 hypothetical protein F8O09_00600 [Pseudoclavibacter sp. CFCC 11306]
MSAETPPVIQRIWRACLLVLGCAIALNLAVCLLGAIWMWIVAALAVAAVVAAMVAWWRYRNRF